MPSENSSVQIMNWFFGQVCVPVTFVVVAMAIIYFSHQDLVSTLADGELLLVGTLLSLGLFGEMMFTDSRPGRPLLLVSFFLCILFVIAYVWLKTQLVNY